MGLTLLPSVLPGMFGAKASGNAAPAMPTQRQSATFIGSGEGADQAQATLGAGENTHNMGEAHDFPIVALQYVG